MNGPKQKNNFYQWDSVEDLTLVSGCSSSNLMESIVEKLHPKNILRVAPPLAVE